MKFSTSKIIHTNLQAEWPKVVILLCLVFLFAFNVIGFLDFGSGSILNLDFRQEVFFNSTGEFILPPLMTSVEFILLMISGLVMAIFSPLLTPIAASLLVGLLSFPPLYLGMYVSQDFDVIPMQYSLLVLLVLFGMNVLFTYFSETQKKQKLISVFGRYVPPGIVDEVSKRPEMPNLDGELKNLTVLFCDLKNFTGISEQLSPQQLVSMLNVFFTEMTTVLYKYGATIDKYIGDSIMAFWGAPLPQEDHAKLAVLASFEMHKVLESLSSTFKQKGLPALKMGIGINTGLMNVGNMGSSYRLSYTVIGDDVNLSSRLESLTRVYGVPTLVGEKTVRAINDIVFRELDTVAVKGKQLKSSIFQPVCMRENLTEETKLMLAKHDEALLLSYSGKTDQAKKAFAELSERSPQDNYYRYMIKKMS